MLFCSPSRFRPDVDALLKKSEAQHEQPEDGCPFGPLTQRLLQALVEVRGLRGAMPQPGSVGPGHGLAQWGSSATVCHGDPSLVLRSLGEHNFPC